MWSVGFYSSLFFNSMMIIGKIFLVKSAGRLKKEEKKKRKRKKIFVAEINRQIMTKISKFILFVLFWGKSEKVSSFKMAFIAAQLKCRY